jgi:hypothetical protein
MDGRIVQLSRQVEEFLQASVELLESSEHEDTLVSCADTSEVLVMCIGGCASQSS